MKISRDRVKEWKQAPDGFFKWIDDVQPLIPSRSGGFEVFIPTDSQVEFFTNALKTDDQGNFVYQTIVDSEPRRHSKTVKLALMVLWRFTLFPAQTIVPLANSTQQVQGVSFKLLRQIILNTDFLRNQVGADNVQGGKIEYPAMQSSITPVSTNISSLYGQKISVAWCTEIHQAPDPEAPQVLASSIGDTENSWFLVDSTVDPPEGPLHALEKIKDKDESIYFYKIEYRSLKEAEDKSPPWISRSWLRSRQKQLLPSTFSSQHLNARSQSTNSLFEEKDLKACRVHLKNAMAYEDVEKLAEGKKFVFGSGLDRAYGFSAHGDKTVWCSVAKIQHEDDPHFYVVNCNPITASLGSSIKKAIQRDYTEYKLENIALESFNAQDIYTWAIEQGYPAELIHPTSQLQTNAFLDLHNIVREGRLHIPMELRKLYDEMKYFSYEQTKSGYFTFGTRRRKDDFVYALCWAVYSLRKQELNIYEIDSINCRSISKHAPFCYLRNGDHILSCANQCPAHIKVKQMYNKYINSNPDSDLTLQKFFSRLVKVTGFRTYKAM